MRITLEKLLEEYGNNTWELCGDSTGYGKVVTWMTSILDDMDTSMLTGGELLVFQRVENLEQLKCMAEKSRECRAAGILIRKNVLTEKEEEVYLRKFAEENHFSLIIVPDDFNILQLEKNVNEFLLRMKNPEIIEESFIGDFLFNKEKNQILSAVEQMEGLGLDPLKAYQVALIKITTADKDHDKDGNMEQYVYQTLLKQIKSEKWHCYSMHYARLMILLMEAEEDSAKCMENYELLERNIEKIKEMFPNINSKIAIGRRYSQITRIKESFDEALFILNISKMLQQKDSDDFIISYYDVGFYQLLRMAHDTEEFVRFYQERIGILEKYDKVNGTDLTETLWTYLKNSCNMNQTSQEMFVHMNTLRYRFNKIEELTQMKFKNMNQLLELYICYHIKNYMGFKKGDSSDW